MSHTLECTVNNSLHSAGILQIVKDTHGHFRATIIIYEQIHMFLDTNTQKINKYKSRIYFFVKTVNSELV